MLKDPPLVQNKKPNPKAKNQTTTLDKKGHFATANFCKIVLYANSQSCLLCYPDRIA